VLIHQEKLWADYSVLDRDLTVMMIVISLIIIGFHSFIYYFRNWQEAEVMSERLQKENIRSQFEALKHQIEPHFFFNSLSVLTSLVHKDADLATQYINQLSKIYRYVLEVRDETVVPLSQELDFLNAYIFLMTVRHNDSIRFRIEISDETSKYTFIPKNSLQMLAENAVKHNRFSKESPLVVRISEDVDYIRVINNIDRRELIDGSSGIGLENIRKRYELISEKRIEMEETAMTFCVKLPKLRKSELKSINL
jgi:LytS/YehU family sensor histidine kinase